MNDIERAIKLLKTINQNMKVDHMTKDMWDGATEEETREYIESFGLINLAISALEKQAPNKPMMMQAREPEYMCKCGAKYYFYIRKIADKYCGSCGQRLDLSDIEEEVYCGECEHYIYAEQSVNGKERVCEMIACEVSANEVANKCKDFKEVEE